jgi:hypothetical protein
MIEFKHAFFHSYIPFLDFLGQIMHVYKSNWEDSMEIIIRFLQTFSSIVT